MSLISRIRTFATIAALGLVAVVAGVAEATIVRFQTTLGNIDIRLYDSATPLHTANLVNYINSNRYDGTFIHRSAKNQSGEDFVIQGGGYKILSSLLAQPIESGWTRIQSFGNVTNEPGISNLRGTVALAKGSGVSSGSSEWFINLNDDNVFLDQGPPVSNLFTVFGRVLGNGMAVADAIAALDRVNARVSTPTGTKNSAFSEVPVLDIDKVVAQQDVRNDDVVQLIDAIVLNLPAGDYDFNGVVNTADYSAWRRTYRSKTAAAADGNGNGIVDAADFVVWRNSMAGSAAGAVNSPLAVPEPAAALMAMTAMVLLTSRRRRPGLLTRSM
jgi:peptidyl-prolyl cis-trans isomerase A (cyclophilin A)